MSRDQTWGWAALVALAAGLAGCGTPGPPQPPSLKLPQRATDLEAVRNGDQVTVTWTMPKKTTDKQVLKGDVTVRVCRSEGKGKPCVDAGAPFSLAPSAAGTFTETLPAALASGAPRELDYCVELKNRKGRSAGLSDPVVTLGGAPPAPLDGFKTEVRKAGIVLSWTPDDEEAGVRLERKLLTPPAAKPKEDLAAPPPEPLEQDLWVAGGSKLGHAIDKDIRFGETYEYRAQRMLRVTVGSATLELGGEFSAPVRVEAKDVFPPATPTGLAAVAALGEKVGETAIDLSWTPDSEADLAGYAVYRREGDGAWQRISPEKPVVAPAFHDPNVQPGHTYRYAVSAVDQGGHESARSVEAQESVPRP